MRSRPGPYAIQQPGPRQESVWDFPRPPALQREPREGVVRLDGVEIARSSHLLRMAETASPPTYYFPRADVRMDLLADAHHPTFCEWKGRSQHFDIAINGNRLQRAAFAYPEPMTDQADYTAIADCIAFYPQQLECWLGDERVTPQPGGYYAGWITADILGPFKGEPGTQHW